MKKIKALANRIADELCDARDYAEEYLDHKAKGDSWANKYKEMANDELKHAEYIHEIALQEIEELSKVYTPPESMEEEWNKTHKKYVEKTAWIRQMLAL